MNKKNYQGETPLQVAAINGDLDKAKLLLQQVSFSYSGVETSILIMSDWSYNHKRFAFKGHFRFLFEFEF